MAAGNQLESQAKQDVKHLKNEPAATRSEALDKFVQHAQTMSPNDVKSEQKYWNAVAKTAHKDLPELVISKDKNGNVESVKEGNKSVYDRAEEVQKTVEHLTGGLKKGQGPFQAFKDAGLTDEEASKKAGEVMKGTGRTTFKQGEKLGVHSDGSVSTSSEHNGVTTQEKYNDISNKDTPYARETKVTQQNGDSTTTFKDDKGIAGKTVEHKEGEAGKSEDITYKGDGVSKQKLERKITNGDTSTTTKYREDSTESEIIKVDKNGTTDMKIGPGGGTNWVQKIETGKDGLKTTTDYDPKSHLPSNQHKETADGYVDTTYKKDGTVGSTIEHKNKPNDKGYIETEMREGKLWSTIERSNGEKGSYMESRKFAATDTSTARTVDISQSSPNPDGSFTRQRIETQSGRTTAYAMDMKDKNNGTGTRIKSGPQIADTKAHKVIFKDGHYEDIK